MTATRTTVLNGLVDGRRCRRASVNAVESPAVAVDLNRPLAPASAVAVLCMLTDVEGRYDAALAWL